MNARTSQQMTRVICFFFACISCLSARAQSPASRGYRPPPQYAQIGKPDQEEGRRILEAFRKQGMYSAQHYIEFELRVMPRRGDERIVPGRLWTAQNERGPILRIVVAPGVVGQETRLLVQNGPQGGVWRWKSGDARVEGPLSAGELFQPLAGTDVAAFDLQMPFLYWPDYIFEGVSKVRGRPAHSFLMYPPAGVTAQRPDLTGVRVYLDAQYHQPVGAEHIGAEGKVLKTFSVIDLKKIGEEWIVKSLDFRDETTRNKSRFSVTGVASDLEFLPGIFEESALVDTVRPPAQDRIERVSP